MSVHDALGHYLPEAMRSYLEETYYARINARASLEYLLRDPDFLQDPARHVGLFPDHGVVHVRDVARQVLQVLEVIHGRLIPARPAWRFAGFMRAYGVLVAYLHDIGMVDFSAFGRAMHPEYAAQAVFRPELDPIVDLLWRENWGNLAWRLLNLAGAGALTQDPRLVLREMLSLSTCHSKSKVPAETLNDPHRLREVMLIGLSTDLRDLYREQEHALPRRSAAAPWEQTTGRRQPAPGAAAVAAPPPPPQLGRFYADFAREAFQWLTCRGDATRELVGDVIDTLRALRCADALRQRGTVLKTSGGYEIFIDQVTADAIVALRQGSDRLFLVADADIMRVGEANLAGSELDRDGDLRVSFHRGAFLAPGAAHKAARSAAVVINDIQADIIESFRGLSAAVDQPPAKSSDAIRILIEGVDDNPAFAELVAEQLLALNPALGRRVCTVPSLQHIPDAERVRYLNAPDVSGAMAERRALLEAVGRSGHKIAGIDPVVAFAHVRVIALRGGETLIEAGSPPGFVYIPLGEGLRIIPLGGYRAFSVRAWMPLGNTGVIRGAVRNATVVADQPVELLAIPREVYLRHWHATFTMSELLQRLGLS